MPAKSIAAPKSTATKSPYDYKRFSQLAGAFHRLPKKGYKVKYRPLMNKRDALKAILLVLLNLGFQIAFLIWLFLPSHINFENLEGGAKAAVIFIIVGIALIEGSRLFNMASLCLSTLLAREPNPVRPEKGTRLAFTTTIVPGKEPWELAEKTLKAMLKVRHNGPFDVWLLDEGNDPAIKAACEKMGVKHFSRKGIDKWNQPTGNFKAKTKHGNHNGWLDAYGDNYDYVISVDTDHVPHANFAERFLGYFRDPDVAFVVGPQVYGNYDNLVTKCAESQAYVFQATIQRGGNAYQNAMFVGTNHAYRVKTWKQIGGFQDSITEDMLTSMVIHSTKNPRTGKYWKSVYTPDVVAVGEGPSSWTDFFSQQLRWARGANEVMVTRFPKLFWKMPLKTKIQYSLLIAYYPTMAISWVFGIFAGMVYMTLGQTGLQITGEIWLALYADVTILGIILYTWLRKYNVSPHEKPGTIGFGGMFFGIVSAPIYVTALVSTFMRSKPSFVVTAKGDSSSPDRIMTFKKHIMWGSFILYFLIYSIVTDHTYPIVLAWSAAIIIMSMSPLFVWQIMNLGRIKATFRRATRRTAKLLTATELAKSKENA